MDIFCKVTAQGLIPMYDSDYDEKQRLREGSVVKCSITLPRNYEFHKKFFALVRLTFQNLPERLHLMLNIHSEDDMLACLKLDLGYANIVYHGSRAVVVTKSISFASMDQHEFETFYDRCIDTILNKYLPGTTRQEIVDEIVNFK